MNDSLSLLDDADWRTRNVGHALFGATDKFVREKLRIVHEAGFPQVTGTQVAVFRHLDVDGTRLSDIAARANMTKQSMRELVDKAQADGFVERHSDPLDGRAKIVAFTSEGLMVLAVLHRGIAEAERRMAKVIGDDFMAEMRSRLSCYTGSGRPRLASDATLGVRNAAWRTLNIGRIMLSATRVYVQDVLDHLHATGFEMVTPVLLTLFRHLDLNGTRLTEMAVRARMTKQGMQELVEKAVALDLIVRDPDPDDGRAKIIRFSPLGLRMLEQLRDGVMAADERMAELTSPGFLERLVAQLERYVSSAEAATGPGLRAGIFKSELAAGDI